MKNLYLKAGKTQDVFNDLKDNFNGSLTLNNDQYDLDLQSNFAQGKIKGAYLQNGMTYMEFEVVFDQDVRLSMESYPTKPLFFAYCSEGTLQHSFGESGKKKIITKNQSAILKNTTSVNNILYFKKYIPTKFIVIGTNFKSSNAKLGTQLKKTFFNTKEDYLKIGVQNFQIAKELRTLKSLNTKEVFLNSKNTILETILKFEIKQNTDGFSEIVTLIQNFTIKRWDDVINLSHFIMNLPKEIEVRFLALKSEFIHRVQEGFKLNSNRTMHNFLVYLKIKRQVI